MRSILLVSLVAIVLGAPLGTSPVFTTTAALSGATTAAGSAAASGGSTTSAGVPSGGDIVPPGECPCGKINPPACIDAGDIFPSFCRDEGIGSGLLVLSILLASCAGIGGGGLFIPIFLFVFGYRLSVAHMLSHVMVFTSAVAQTGINVREREADGSSVIKLATCAVVTPVFLSGHAIGVTVFPLCPDALVVFLLSGLLGFVTYQTARKFLEVLRKERAATKIDSMQVPLTRKTVDDNESLLSVNDSAILVPQKKSGFDFKSLFILVLVWIILGVVYFIMGSKTEHSIVPGAHVCGPAYWTSLAMGIILTVVVAVFAAYNLLRSDEGRKFGWDGVVRLCTLSAFGGIFAGLVGIGGAQFIVPLLLSMGFSGLAASSTAALAVIVAVSSDVGRAAIDGRMTTIPHLVLWSAALAFVSALCGRSLSVAIIRRFKRMAPIVFSQALVLGLCSVLALVSGITDIKDGKPFQFTTTRLC